MKLHALKILPLCPTIRNPSLESERKEDHLTRSSDSTNAHIRNARAPMRKTFLIML